MARRAAVDAHGAVERHAERDRLVAPRQLAFTAYVTLVIGSGVLVLAHALVQLDVGVLTGLEPAFWAVCALLLVAELRPVVTAGGRNGDGHVLTTAFVFAVLLRYGSPLAVLVQALATTATDVARGRAPWRIAFNVAQYALSWAAAGAVMRLVGRTGDALAPTDVVARDLVAALLGALAYFVVNQALVTQALAFKLNRSWWGLVREDLPSEAVSNGALLALSPLVVLALEEGPLFVPLLVPPLIAVYAVGALSLDREQQALTDALTGLPNRKLLLQRTTDALEHDDAVAALVLLDLDRFKEVNDTLGHHVGDALLDVVGQRLAEAVRAVDTVARLGGDEFAVLLPGADAATAERTARRLLDALAAPILLGGLLLDVDASVGVAVAPQDGAALDELLQHADVAMYLAKETGAGVEQYDPARDRNSTERLAMLGDLRRAVLAGELEVHYQPQAELRTGRVDTVEALVRWRAADGALVPPDRFIPLAERTGLIVQITGHVLDVTLAQVARWRADGLDLTAAVNVSVRDLSGGTLAADVAAALARHGVPARCLQLEVTEGSLFADSHRAATTLRQLEELGVALSLDDFGTGFSSLSHLRRLPVREIKVDRSFVGRMLEDPRDAALVRSVVDLAGGLGMRVVAEGVEDQPTWDALAAMGCDAAQGWHLARPLPADLLTSWLVDRQAVPTLSR